MRKLATMLMVMVVAMVAGGLTFVGEARANLVTNGDFESDSGGWTGDFSRFYYERSPPRDYEYEGPGPKGYDSDDYYGWNMSGASQTVTVTDAVSAATIDADSATYDFNAMLASFAKSTNRNGDVAILTLKFYDADSNQVGSTVTLDGQTSTGGNNHWDGTSSAFISDGWTQTNWSFYQATGTVPTLARTAIVVIDHPSDPHGSPDNYVDDVVLDVDVVPEPATMGLLGLGGVMVLLQRRGR